MSEKQWIIYGAYGYSGLLIAREAKRLGLNPILAGRSQEKVETLANELGFRHSAFSLDDPSTVADQLKEMHLVLHCAGPFSATSPPMVEACLRTKTHYLDITGEIEVFEYIHNQNDRIRDAGIVMCPGVGFDVIPTDCLAATLKDSLPDATHLMLGFESKSGMSAGTAKTSVEGIKVGGRIRQDSVIMEVPLAYKERTIDFGNGEKNAVSIPWGDVSTAYYTTGIPNIEVYVPLPPSTVSTLKMMRYIRPILATDTIQSILKYRITKTVTGPSEEERTGNPSYVWGEVLNEKGEKKTARVKTANGYVVTMYGSLAIVSKLLDEDVDPGSKTPSQIMGKEFVASLPGSSEIEFD